MPPHPAPARGWHVWLGMREQPCLLPALGPRRKAREPHCTTPHWLCTPRSQVQGGLQLGLVVLPAVSRDYLLAQRRPERHRVGIPLKTEAGRMDSRT